MADASQLNDSMIEQFRANGGRLGGPFEGAPVLLVHHVGRRSGEERVSPMMYLADPDDPASVYVFASAAGRPAHPGWYHNLTSAGSATIEIGTETHPVTVER